MGKGTKLRQANGEKRKGAFGNFVCMANLFLFILLALVRDLFICMLLWPAAKLNQEIS